MILCVALLALVMVSAIQTGFIIAANADATVASATENWVNVSDAFTKQIGATVDRCRGLVVTPTGDLVMQTTEEGICVSIDKGATWSIVANNRIVGRCENAFGMSVNYPYDGRMAFFAYDGTGGTSGGMSVDGAKTWKPFAQMNRGVQYADVDWNAHDTLTIFGMTHEPFFSVLSQDGGTSWLQLDKNETGAEDNYWVGIIDGKTLVRYNRRQSAASRCRITTGKPGARWMGTTRSKQCGLYITGEPFTGRLPTA